MAPLLLVMLGGNREKAQLSSNYCHKNTRYSASFVSGAEASEDGKGNTEGRTEAGEEQRKATMPSQRD